MTETKLETLHAFSEQCRALVVFSTMYPNEILRRYPGPQQTLVASPKVLATKQPTVKVLEKLGGEGWPLWRNDLADAAAVLGKRGGRVHDSRYGINWGQLHEG